MNTELNEPANEYPELSEEGQKEAEQLFEAFKNKFHKAANDVVEEVFGNIYSGFLPDIESDSWANYRNVMLRSLTNSYPDAKIKARYDWVKIRKQILEENREEIIQDLNQDLLAEIESLKQQIKDIYKSFESSY